MRLEIFQSDKGDCLLLEGADGTLFLCDGGMRNSMREHVRAALSRFRVQNRAIEYAYVSHIDQDHISGVLQLLEDEAAWRVFDHHRAAGDTAVRPPRVPRPPEIRGILHNAFHDQVTKNRGAIRNLLAASAPALLATAVPDLTRAARELEAIATSIPEALKVSRLASPEALDIPVNRLPGRAGPARLVFIGQPPGSFEVGSMRFTVVGPGEEELRSLRDGWQNWLRANRATVKALRAELKRRIDEFTQGAQAGEPFDLRDWNGIPDHKGVTAPNVASLMFLVEEDGRRLLLTGDSQQDFIVRGLRTVGLLGEGHVHLDVLKVQHHGSEHNLDAEFARTVSADHYVFCGNGEHGNPEPEVLDHIVESRVGAPGRRARSPRAADRDFHFWFSTTAEAQPPGSEARREFARIERHVADLESRAGGRLLVHYNKGVSTTLQL